MAPKFRLNEEAQAHLLNMLSVHRPAGPNRHFSMMAIQLGYEGLANHRTCPEKVWDYFRALYNLDFFDNNTKLPYLTEVEEFSLDNNPQFKGLLGKDRVTASLDKANGGGGGAEKSNGNNENNMDSEEYSSVSGASTPVSVASNVPQPKQPRQRKSQSSSSTEAAAAATTTGPSTSAVADIIEMVSHIGDDDGSIEGAGDAGESILIKAVGKRGRASGKPKKIKNKGPRRSRQVEPAVEPVAAPVSPPAANPPPKKKARAEEKLAASNSSGPSTTTKPRGRGKVRLNKPVRKNLRESRTQPLTKPKKFSKK